MTGDAPAMRAVEVEYIRTVERYNDNRDTQ